MSAFPNIHTDAQAALDQYQRDGFLIQPGLFSDSECDEIMEAARGLPSALDGSQVPTMNPHRLDVRFRRPLHQPRVRSAMEVLLNGRVSGLQTQYFFGRPGIKGFTLHQDNHYVQAPPDAFASAWLALEDVDPENGSLFFYPGSHREPLLDVRPVEQETTFGQDPNANSQECILPAGYTPVDISARRGTVVFLHGHVLHASYNNRSANRTRQVLLMTFIREGAPFRSGRSAKREAFDVYGEAA